MPATDHSALLSEDARNRFGRTITAWVERAGWSHDIPLRWGKAAGFPTVADSTFNRLQRGKIAQPYPLTFVQFGLMNERLARKEYGLLPDDALLPRIARQRPIEHEDGRIWTATDFFSHFIGELGAPAWAQNQTLPSLEEAVEASAKVTQAFKQATERSGLPLAEAWQSLAAAAADAPEVLPPLSEQELETLRMVLSAWHVWTPEQLQQLRDLDGVLRPLSLIEHWADKLKTNR